MRKINGSNGGCMPLSFLRLFLCFFVATSFIFTAYAAPLAPDNYDAIYNHINLLSELKQRFSKNERRSRQPYFGLTQSQAHMDIYKKDINSYWGHYLEQPQYKKIVNTILDREREYGATHYVFYHAQRFYLRILQDVLNEIYQFLHLHRILDDFPLARIWFSVEPHMDLNDFIDKKEGSELGIKHWYDHEDYLVEKLLSVNLSLFGSTTYGGECTFSYFVNDTSISAPWLDSLLEKIWKEFGFKESYKTEILNLEPAHTSGSFMQILVPKDKVDQVAYLSHAFGTPYRQPLIPSVFDAKRKRHTAISPILELYRTNPEQINKDGGYTLDQLQARMVFSRDFLVNPESGIVIYRYAAADEKELANYHKRLKRIMKEVLIHWLGGKKRNRRMNHPLDRLLHFIDEQLLTATKKSF